MGRSCLVEEKVIEFCFHTNNLGDKEFEELKQGSRKNDQAPPFSFEVSPPQAPWKTHDRSGLWIRRRLGPTHGSAFFSVTLRCGRNLPVT